MLDITNDAQRDRLFNLNDAQRHRCLQIGLDAVTLQLADPSFMFAPADKDIKRLQAHTRMLASRIRAYEKLRRLKDLMIQNEEAAEEDKNPQVKASQAKLAEIQTPATQTRAERRRHDRANRKAMKRAYKNNTVDQSLAELNAQLAEVEKMTAALCACNPQDRMSNATPAHP